MGAGILLQLQSRRIECATEYMRAESWQATRGLCVCVCVLQEMPPSEEGYRMRGEEN